MKKFLAALSLVVVGAVSILFAACTGGGKVQLNFETNGGADITAVEVQKDEEYTLPIPEKEDCEFDGWYLSAEFEGDAVTKVTVSENTTVYAKWTQLYTVNFDTDGGTLSNRSLKLKAGVNLYDALTDCIPVKTDYKFDAWINGSDAVTADTLMPAADVSLTARYKVKYTVEIYKENIDGTGYAKEEQDVTGYGYVGAATTPDVPTEVAKGFTPTENKDAVMSMVLSGTASNNVFRIYFSRDTYQVNFHSNNPDGSDAVVKTLSAKYGVPIQLPDDLIFDGYCLLGWSLSANGESAYDVDSVTGKIFNSSEEPEAGDNSVLIDRSMALYAVWQKGYTDMLGGKDVIFLFNAQSKVAYLCREGVYFEGEYRASSNRVTFANDDTELYFEGKLLENGKFVYYSDVRAVSAYDYYEVKLNNGKPVPSVSSSTQLHFDGFDGITYTVKGENDMTSSSNGTFVIDEDGFCAATFTDGDLAGKTLTIWLTQASVGGVATPVFLVRDDVQYELDTIYRSVFNTSGLTYYLELYKLTFSGFGTAGYFDGSTTSDVFTFLEDGKLTVASTSAVMFEAKIETVLGENCYTVYDASTEFTANAGNDVLTLDGYGAATYKTATGEVSGYYEAEVTGFGYCHVIFYANGAEYADFIVSKSEDDKYTFAVKPLGYAEYNYTDDKVIYTATYLVLNDESEGSASIYCTDEEGNLVKISTGTYQAVNGLYVYTKTTLEIPDGLTVPFSTTDFNSFVFTLGTRKASSGATYYVNYWTEYTATGGTTKLYTEYTCGNDLLALLDFGTIAIYKTADAKDYFVGSYTTSKSVLTLKISSTVSLYFLLDEDNKTFERLAFAPYSVNALTPDWIENENIFLSFSGKTTSDNEIICTYNVVNGEETVTVAGKVTSNSTTGIFTFISDDGNTSFEYMMFMTSTKSFVSIYDATYAGTYTGENGATLTLDGFGGSAEYDGTDNMYMVADENVIAIRTSDGYIYADVNTNDKTFTVRGSEFGTYLLTDNQNLNGYYLSFDGYGKVAIYSMVDDGNGGFERDYIDENGMYEIDGDDVTVKYTNGTAQTTLSGRFGILTYDGYAFNIFVISYDDIARTYVSETDWSVLKLDGNGNAVKYDIYGTEEYGSYTIVSETLFYYVNDESTDAAIYRYNVATGTATPLKLRARGYYTSDMESLLFSQYGFAIFNGSTRYYYDLEGEQITLYRRAEEGETGANAYGFIKQEFGQFSNEIKLDNKTYYYNEGYNITFNRAEADKNKYPLPVNFGTTDAPVYASIDRVIFTPSGDNGTYSVNGIAYIQDKQYNCTVSRTVEDDGSFKYFVTIGNYRYSVSFNYAGLTEDEAGNDVSASNFTVLGLERYNGFYSETYLGVLNFAAIFGISVPNNWGILQLVDEYAEDGTLAKSYFNGIFGSSSYMFDTTGKVMTLTGLPYEYDEDTGLYSATFEYGDGYTYKIGFVITRSQSISSVYSYTVIYCTRVQSFTSGDYKLDVETLIASDMVSAKNIGMIYDMSIYKNGTLIPNNGILVTSDATYYISRTLDEAGKITATEYYSVDLTRAEAEEGNLSVPLYTAAVVTKLEAVATYYDEVGKSYADVDTANNKVLSVYVYDAATEKGTAYGVTACEYDAATSTYTVTLTSGKKYTVKVENGKITLTENTQEESGGSGNEG